MAKPNFKYQKRQKELAKQQKNEEKRLRKLEKRHEEASDEVGDSLDDETTLVEVEAVENESDKA